MVKVGFICEGYTESILLQSDPFRQLLSTLNIEPLSVINAQGSGNLLPHNILGYIERLEKTGAEAIVILTDLDEDVCITKTKVRIGARLQDIVVIAVQKIEAWFLAANKAMQNLLGDANFHFDLPEGERDPFETINSLLVSRTGKGIGKKSGGKIKLATRLIEKGLDLSDIAQHPNCPSAKYFLDTLTTLGK